MEQVYKTTGRKPEKLEKHGEAPKEFAYIWNVFMELKTDDHISYTEIRSWSELMSIPIQPWEVDIVKSLDRLFWKVMNE